MNLKKGKVFTSKLVGTGPSSYEKRIYRAAVSQRRAGELHSTSECLEAPKICLHPPNFLFHIRDVLFWDVRRLMLLVSYRRFGTT